MFVCGWIDVPDQIGTLSQVGTSSYMGYAMWELTQRVSIWLKKFLLGPVDANFTFHVLFIFRLVHVFSQNLLPGGGVLPNKEVRGLGPHIRFRGKIWGKVRASSQNKRKNLGSSVTKRRISWEKLPIWRHIWNSGGKIWGICHLYFWRQNLGLQQEFQRQNLGPSPPGNLLQVWRMWHLCWLTYDL